MSLLLTNIKELIGIDDSNRLKVCGADMQTLNSIKNAFVLVKDGLIANYGSMELLTNLNIPPNTSEISLSGKLVLPAWCDSHTHIVYAGNREQEFVDRIKGLSYEQIAQKGGGILNSAKKLQQTDENQLYEESALRLDEVIQQGTGAVEIKSGYGLTFEAELKMLRVIRRLKETYPISIKATFLGAHALPVEYKSNRQAYLRLLIEELLPAIHSEKLADYIDVFCETGYFTVAETEQLMEAGNKYGLKAKIHVNQFTAIGGIQAAVTRKALSVDHLEVLNNEDIEALKDSDTIPVALPSCSFFISIPYTPARRLIDNGLAVALASDFNPGTSPTGNMNFIVAAACIKMKLTPEEAVNAATLNGAYAMELAHTLGSISRGKIANLIVTKQVPSLNFLPYSFGSNLIDKVMINGNFI